MGHAGTLDPLATGLLIVGVEAGTKKLKKFLKMPKVYEAGVLLGKKTSTGDAEGEVMEEKEITEIDETKVRKAVSSLKGELLLEVPVYSAVKVSGTPLYRLARTQGFRNIKPPKRKMEVVWIKYQGNRKQGKGYIVHLTMKVSSGTYVRSLAEELGKRLKVPASLQRLRRLKIGPFDVKQAEKIPTAV